MGRREGRYIMHMCKKKGSFTDEELKKIQERVDGLQENADRAKQLHESARSSVLHLGTSMLETWKEHDKLPLKTVIKICKYCGQTSRSTSHHQEHLQVCKTKMTLVIDSLIHAIIMFVQFMTFDIKCNLHVVLCRINKNQPISQGTHLIKTKTKLHQRNQQQKTNQNSNICA